MKLTLKNLLICLSPLLLLAGCMSDPVVKTDEQNPNVLIVHEDGTMQFRNRLLNKDDVIIYPDGFGGEKAAVKIRTMEPLHPAFYRDSIVVQRHTPLTADKTVQAD